MDLLTANDLDALTFYTCEQVGNILTISRAQAYRLVEEGEIASRRYGNCVRVSAQDLVDYINRTYKPSITKP
jgi:excisionase family DNA binding protein